MGATKSDPRSISLSKNLYHLLLAVYPTAFRQEYGSLMVQVFTDRAREMVRRNGAQGLLSWWVRTLFDMLATAIEQHSQKGVDMSKEKFIKLSGWSMALGSLLIGLGLLASSRPEYLEYDIYSQPVDRYLNVLDLPLFIIGMLLVCLGLAGMIVRYGQAAGGAGRAFLVLAILSGMVSSAGGLGLGIVDSDPWWSMFFLGATAVFLCLALFGVVCLQRPVLQRWKALPLVTMIGLPLSVVLAMGMTPELPGAVFTVMMVVSLVGLAGLGYLLQDGRREAVAAAQPA
jgi:hypothetical protein